MSDLHTDDIGNIVLPLAARYSVWSVMSNHVHTVLRLLPVQAEKWSEEQVIHRWQQLFSLPVLIE